MRVVLVDNFIMPDGTDRSLFDVHPHLGLASIAAVAERENHGVCIYDPKREVRFGRHPYDQDFYQRATEDIVRLSPDTVGFTTLGCSFLFAVNVAARLKRLAPELPIMLGGPHATMLSGEILAAYNQFDVVVRHEAEETFAEVLANLGRRTFDKIPGMTWRAGKAGPVKATAGAPKIQDLDSLPVPLYDLYPVRDLELDLMRIEAGRGCPFDCYFCSTATFFQRSYRLKSPERLLNELDLLHERYGASEFKLDHDLFTVNRRKVLAFCEVLEERDYRWRVSARTDCVDTELLEAMASAGCIGLYFGIETGSPRMQQLTSKRLKLDGIERIFDAAQNLGIEITTSFITGYPEETQHDQDQSLDLMADCFRRPQDACIPQLHVLLPEPGTPLFERHRPELQYDGYTTKFNARLLQDSDRTEILQFPDLYSTYYHYPAAMPRFHYTFAVDSIDAFRVVGHEILSYSLKFFERRLSALVGAFRGWVQAQRPGATVTTELVLDFISERFGPRHHLTSLYRFGLAVNLLMNSLLGEPAGEFKAAHFNPRRRYRLNPQSHVFVDLHDCGRLLELIRRQPKEAGPLEFAAAGEPACYLSIVEDGVASNYEIDPGVGNILALFKRPSSIRAVTGFLRQAVPDAPIRESWFKELVDIGALTPSLPTDSRAVRGMS
jgi:radical SAM superfamily enzyme YgiQ (UPF0313 family)